MSKRKQAGAGPKTKASRKREVRKSRRGGRGRRALAALKGAGSGLGSLAAGFLKTGGAQALQGVLEAGFPHASEEDLAALAAAAPGGGAMVPMGPTGMALPGQRAKVARYTKSGKLTFRKRPAMQATNTRALRRSVRRLEAFNHVVSRVYKAMPRLRPVSAGGRVGRRGHKPGCKCVACR